MSNSAVAERIINEVKKAVVGKDEAIKLVLSAVLAEGHILIDDIPGVGKTTMAVAFSKALGLSFKRMQFTPDVLPSDILGFSVYNRDRNTMVFQKGAVFTNLFLADEINRTSPKTQSALLEVMEEYHVSVDGRTYPIEKPFIVLATENPAGSAGTMRLPESEMDRFMICISMGYPTKEEEIEILKRKEAVQEAEQVTEAAMLLQMQKEQRNVFIHDAVYDYMVRLVDETRDQTYVELGGSPRASLALSAMSRSYAYIAGRDYVLPEDVAAVFIPVLNHRVIMNRRSRIDNVAKMDVLEEILNKVQRPAQRKEK